MTNSAQTKRIDYIDRLKGLAIALVVMGHVYLFSYNHSSSTIPNVIGSFHMALFMFLSGFVSLSGITPPNYWTARKMGRKILRLLLPMLFFGLGFTLILNQGRFLKSLDFIWAPAKNGYWYLMSLSVFYVSLLLFRINKKGLMLLDICIAIFTWVLFYILWKSMFQIRDPFCMLDCANHYPFFILGVFARKYNLIDKMVSHNSIFGIALAGYVLLMLTEFPIHALDSMRRHILVPLCMVAMLTIVFRARHNCNSRLENGMAFVGRHTLDIYVIHYFLLLCFHLDGVDRWLVSTGNLTLSALLSMLITIVIVFTCILVGKILRRSRWMNAVLFGEW